MKEFPTSEYGDLPYINQTNPNDTDSAFVTLLKSSIEHNLNISMMMAEMRVKQISIEEINANQQKAISDILSELSSIRDCLSEHNKNKIDHEKSFESMTHTIKIIKGAEILIIISMVAIFSESLKTIPDIVKFLVSTLSALFK